MRRMIWILGCIALCSLYSVVAEGKITDDFKPVCKSLDSLIRERTTVQGELKLRAVMKRGRALDFYFTNSLSDLPWSKTDAEWLKKELKKRLPEEYQSYSIGRISSAGEKIEDLVTGELGFSGKPDNNGYRSRDRSANRPIVTRVGEPAYEEGLDGRHIVLWQSHGLYYNQEEDRWKWQRPCLFQTVEDIFTQGFVLPFLVPMLENAGAYVLLPRERDTNTVEIIIDNDPQIDSATLRRPGIYFESGNWEEAGTGFADPKAYYTGTESPFTMGTARLADCITDRRNTETLSEVFWTPDIPKRGEYAVYISYKSLPNSTESAHYTVHHLGGKTEFHVNQKMGGGMWVYLGTFEFEEGGSGFVSLDNVVARTLSSSRGSVVTADAVKIGGGYGNIGRSPAADSLMSPHVSGKPRFLEAARYWLQWAGADSTIFSQNEGESDYKDDFMCRGDWSAYLSGGSAINPERSGKNIPVDLTFALHSDAGTTPNDSTIGTLAIYTLKSENKRKLPTGEDRRTSRELANLIQSQIVNDIRAEFNSDWNRRFIWDRGYRESRTPDSPSMLCELLSHQNFADMRLGLDPAFRFTASRAIYKGMLKYLANRYGQHYSVQPLPINSFSATYVGDSLSLRWKESIDGIEPTAKAESFILQTRIDEGVFDKGLNISPTVNQEGWYSHKLSIEPGHIYSFRITAVNAGGKSFPSETLSAGLPVIKDSLRASITDSCILIINNFDRISAPAWFEYPGYAGFDNRTDSGVPYMSDATYTGPMYNFRRDQPWISDDQPGFGASGNTNAGTPVAGNTFDYPAVHGRAILTAGYPFCSANSSAFCSDTCLTKGVWAIDLICGKQVTVKSESADKPDRFKVFPEALQSVIRSFTSSGGHILVSGANIGTDIWDRVYPVTTDSLSKAAAMDFAQNVLGYKHVTNHASMTGRVKTTKNQYVFTGLKTEESYEFSHSPNPQLYCVEAPDGIAPAGEAGATIIRYEDSGVSAGICSDFRDYRTVCLGFPIETLFDEEDIYNIINSSLEFFRYEKEGL